MRAQRRRRPVGIVRRTRLEQLAVEFLVPVLERAFLREEHRSVALAAVPTRSDEPQQPPRLRSLVQREMEGRVLSYRAARVGLMPRLVVGGEMGARRRLVRGSNRSAARRTAIVSSASRMENSSRNSSTSSPMTFAP